MIKILIADDHAIVRAGLKQIVAEESDMCVAGEAAHVAELMSLLEQEKYSIIVLDIKMPGTSGLEALHDLRGRFPDIPVLILSMHSEDQYGIRAIKGGAAGFLKKVSAPGELVTAIRRIVNGGKYISESLAHRIAATLEADSNLLPHENLSNREFQILCQIASGMTADAIASDLSISVHTVYSYRNRILDKMNMKSNVELTQYALQNKLIEL